MKITLKKIIAAVLMLSVLCPAASAYDIVNLPDRLSFTDALGIYDLSEISGAAVTKLEECRAVDLTSEQIAELFESCKDMTLYRTINPHPFSGIAVEFKTAGEDRHVFYLNSGVQIGLYGESSYICYAPKTLTPALVNIKTIYDEAAERYSNDMFHINNSIDFLKLPSDEWSQTAIKEAAANGLLPYRLTGRYSQNITREEFCVLIGTLIATASNYKDLSSYMSDDSTVYQKISFSDCEGVDESVNILYRMGIVNGKSETTFEPYSLLTREEAAKILCNTALQLAGGGSQLAYIDDSLPLTFNDSADISDWAQYYVKWASQKWIMNGDEGNNFLPKSYYTVDQAVITVNRILKSLRSLS